MFHIKKIIGLKIVLHFPQLLEKPLQEIYRKHVTLDPKTHYYRTCNFQSYILGKNNSELKKTWDQIHNKSISSKYKEF